VRIAAFVVAVAGAMMIVRVEAEPLSLDKSIPLRIDAKHIDVDEKARIATFSDAQVFQGDTRVQCKSLTVRFDDAKRPQQLDCEH
jgi:lipopolysaccharide export system protein LptA